jgi:hypothetical protein
MRDIALYLHIILGALAVVLPLLILLEMKKKDSKLIKPLSMLAALASWLMILPAGYLYLIFYPATKTLINAGSWPWAHSIFMETKEHWGIMVPVIATVALWLVLNGKKEESRRWWILLMVIAALIGIMGRIVKIGALA